MSDATLVIREGAGAGEEHPLDGELVVGREQASSDLVIDDPGVSRRHAAVRALGGSITVEDLDSSNGTFVNGAPIRGQVELAEGDEVQVGGTVFSVHGGEAATAMMVPGAAPTAEHPGPAAPRQPAAGRPPAPSRLAPRPDADSNVPALAAVFLGPLSIFLLLFGSSAAFFVSLPCAIAAIVLGKIGVRNVDSGRAEGHRTLANLGRVSGIVGAVLSSIALVAFLVASIALDATEDGLDSLDGIVDGIRDEIEGVDVPDAPDVDSP
jgi:FHA domain